MLRIVMRGLGIRTDRNRAFSSKRGSKSSMGILSGGSMA